MPHIVIDHSDRLPESVNLAALVSDLHRLVVERVESVGIGKTLARPCTTFVDEVPAVFVHVSVGLLPGRPERVKAEFAEEVLSLLSLHLSTVANPTYSVEVRDLDPSYRLFPSHIDRAAWDDRSDGGTGTDADAETGNSLPAGCLGA